MCLRGLTLTLFSSSTANERPYIKQHIFIGVLFCTFNPCDTKEMLCNSDSLVNRGCWFVAFQEVRKCLKVSFTIVPPFWQMHTHTHTCSHIDKRNKPDHKGRKTNVWGCDMMSDVVLFNILWKSDHHCYPTVTSLFLETWLHFYRNCRPTHTLGGRCLGPLQEQRERITSECRFGGWLGADPSRAKPLWENKLVPAVCLCNRLWN